MLADLVRLGTPMAIKTASIQFSKLFVNSFINSYGIAVSAFAGIANKIASVANLISMAMNNAGSTMVGQNIAARKYSRVNRILLNLTVITLTVSALLSAVMLLIPDAVYSVFTTDPDVIKIGREFVPISLILFLAAALRAVMNALMNGSGNYKINFATAIFDGIVMRIGLALLFGIALGMEHIGFWLGDAVAGFTPFVIGAVFYLSGKWKTEEKQV
jgi:Na+-driven multidrug efflux pump